MREICFEGKRIDIGRWVEGSYLKMFHGLHMDGNHYIHFIVDTKGIRYEVYPETIRQYTGRKDKNGKKIYKGDILEEIGTDVYRYVVHWNETNATYDFVDIITDETFHGDDIYFEKCEVIGNIYDHPDLLEGRI